MSSLSPSKLQGELTYTVTCAICEANYAPSPARQDLLQAPREVVEAAFMSMCHYCFRCRRVACPQCWDAVHKVCGACVLEAQLPFRAEPSSLKGTMFPPPASQVGYIEAIGNVDISGDDAIAPLLICVRAGRFQESTKTPSRKGQFTAPSEDLAKGMERADKSAVDTINRPLQDAGEDHSWVRDDVPLRTWAEFFGAVERVLNVVLGVTLFFVVVLVVLAALSATVNARILGLLHVDIRSEIAYIFSVIQQLRW